MVSAAVGGSKLDAVWQAIALHAKEHPDKLALADIKGQVSYSDLHRLIEFGSSEFARQGISLEDAVLVRMDSSKECIIVYYALMCCGASAVPVSNKISRKSLHHIIEVSGARTAVGIEEAGLKQLSCSFLTVADGTIPQSVTPEGFDPQKCCSEIVFTSGTTGKSKGVMLSAAAAVQGGLNTLSFGFKGADDVELLTTPLYHSQALNTLRANFICGAGSVLTSSYIDAVTLRSLLTAYRCNSINVVPASIKLWLEDFSEQDFLALLKGLAYIEVGAAVMDVPTKKKLLQLLPGTLLCFNYGATECSRTVFNVVKSADDHLEALGRVSAPVKMRLLNDDLQEEAAPGQPGRLAFYGRMVMLGYAGNPQATAAVIRDGWYITGDMARQAADGTLYILGRVDDVINMGGQKISPQELEDLFSQVPGIDSCCCLGVDDPWKILGQIPVLFYTLNADAEDPSEMSGRLSRWAAGNLDRYKRPKIFVQVDEIPVNALSKIDRKELGKRWETVYSSAYVKDK